MTRIMTRSGDAWLPASVTEMVRRRLIDAVGISLTACAAMLLVALMSFSPGDPSFNHATDAPPRNLLGAFGAGASDLMLHTLGLAVALPVMAMGVWGWRIVTRLPLTVPWVRVGALAVASLLLAAAIAALPVPGTWPLAVPLGGLLGMLCLAGLTAGVEALGGPSSPTLVALGCGFIGVAAGAGSFGLRGSEWVRLGRGVARMGRRLMLILTRAALWAWAWGRTIFARISTGVAAGATAADRDPELQRTAEPVMSRIRERAIDVPSPPFSTASRERDTATIPDRAIIPAKSPLPRPGAGALRKGTTTPGEAAVYRRPPLDLLNAAPKTEVGKGVSPEVLKQNAALLLSVLEDFGVRGEIVKIRPGPVVTLYELEPAPGTKTSRVIGLADDIARSMSAISVRVAVVPGRNVIGIEMPNHRRETVYLRELLESEAFERASGHLTLLLGKDIGGGPVFVDLARMPHLLIAGTTGSGKSVAINTMILSLLYQMPPETCRFILIDPKMLELSVYDGIPHLLSPVVTEPSKAVVALKWTVREMEERYRMMSQLGVRNIAGFNARVAEARRKGETLVRRVQTGFSDDNHPVLEDQPLDLDLLPFIVVVVDEMADLMLVAGKDIEAAVQRLAQMARAAGIHLIMATQRPSVDVITGTIKANFPTRVSFHVTSKIDSRTILGEQGAEQLLGQGDMLYMATGGRVTRVHGPFVSDQEVEDIVRFLHSQGAPQYIAAVTEEESDPAWAESNTGGTGGDDSGDDLYDEAVAIIAREGKASTSFVQRRLQIGYNRAARLIERMEAEGVVSKPDRVGRREVLVGDHSAA
jgi:DNA segregation ATPase FtsK/SpoIIIE, S-DNA-T family